MKVRWTNGKQARAKHLVRGLVGILFESKSSFITNESRETNANPVIVVKMRINR